MAHGHEDFKRRTEIQVNAPDVDFSELVSVLTNLVTMITNSPGVTAEVLSDIITSIVNLYSADPELDLSPLAEVISELISLPVVPPGSENSEIVVRLESIVSFDRRGRVIFLNGFEGSLGAFNLETLPGFAGVEKTSDSVKNGLYGVKLSPGVDPNEQVAVKRYQPIPHNNRIGFELSFTVAKWVLKRDWTITYYDGAKVYRAMARFEYLPADDSTKLSIWTPEGFIAITPTPKFYDDYRLHHTLKIVADFDTHKYVRMLIGNVFYDLSTYDLQWGYATTTYPHIHAAYRVYGTAAGAEDSYIDDFILTDNEPEIP